MSCNLSRSTAQSTTRQMLQPSMPAVRSVELQPWPMLPHMAMQLRWNKQFGHYKHANPIVTACGPGHQKLKLLMPYKISCCLFQCQTLVASWSRRRGAIKTFVVFFCSGRSMRGCAWIWLCLFVHGWATWRHSVGCSKCLSFLIRNSQSAFYI